MLLRVTAVLMVKRGAEVQCLPQCGLFSPFVRTARFWVTEWGNQILTNMNIVGIDVLYKPQYGRSSYRGIYTVLWDGQLLCFEMIEDKSLITDVVETCMKVI